MALKLTPESFLNVVKQSNLVTGDVLNRLMADLKSAGVEADSSRAIADELVERGLLTRWQADKLLQGKHKGFFLGKYRLLNLLGKGGMSSVYLAEHVLMRRQCAIKVLPTKRVNDTSYLGRFHREAQAVASLDHPNIIKAYDVDKEIDKDAEIHFLVMEFVDGRSLQETVQQDGQLDFGKAADFIRQSAEGLSHAHQAGMVHRDIKPGNLLVDRNNVVKLLDMGLARFFNEGDEESLTVAHDEKVLGTADYLAPEQALDSHGVDARADIYSLGCTFYFLLTGHPPFTEGTLAQRLMSHQTRTPPRVTIDRPDIPPGLLAILDKMMAKRPEERYQRAAEVAADLTDWLVEYGSDEWRQTNPGLSSSGKIAPAEPKNGPPTSVSEKSEPLKADSAPSQPVAEAGNELSDFLANLGNSGSEGSGKSAGRKDSSIKRKKQGDPPKAKPVDSGSGKQNRNSRPKAPARSVSDSSRDGSERGAARQSAPVATPVPDAPVLGPANEDAVEKEFAIDTSSDAVSPTQVTSPSKQVPTVNDASTDWKDRLMDKRILAAIAGAAVLLLGLGVFAVVSNTGGSDDPEQVPNIVKEEESSSLLGKPIVVGSDGNFPTIKQALDYVTEHHLELNPKEPQVIELAAGEVFEERISLDNSYGVGPEQRFPPYVVIRTDPKEPATLKPPGPEPVIRLVDGVHNLKIQHLIVDATGKDTAVFLKAGLENTQLIGLQIAGYQKFGISAESMFGGIPLGDDGQSIVIDSVTFEKAGESSVGIRMENTGSLLSGDPLEEIVVRNCRFLGPMQAGLEIVNGVRSLRLLSNIFTSDGNGDGILFAGATSLETVIIANNTFYNLNRGITFAEMPSSVLRVGVQRNLFVDLESQEAVLLNGDATKFPKRLAVDANATTGNKTKNGDKQELKLFTRSSKAGLPITFASTDPMNSQFMVPKEADLLPTIDQADIKIGSATFEAKPYVGAVKP